MSFEFTELEIPGVILAEATRYDDHRGFFMETYRRSAFAQGGIPEQMLQDNQSRSRQGVLRGMHYQNSIHAGGRLVRAARGAIFDAAVDIRVGSPTYGRYVVQELTEDNRLQLYIPPGFAHGFAILSDWADVAYKVTAEYRAELESGFAWDDPDIGIPWPITDPVLSERDQVLAPLREVENVNVLSAAAPM